MAVKGYTIIMGACIPTLTPLFNIVVQKRSTKGGSRSNLYATSNPGASHRHPFRGTSGAQFASDAPIPSPQIPRRGVGATVSSKRSEYDTDDAEQGIRIMKTTEVEVHLMKGTSRGNGAYGVSYSSSSTFWYGIGFGRVN